MYSTTDSMSLKTKVHISVATIVDVVLVQHVIQAFIQVLQIEQDHCTSSFHANLDLIDVPADLF